jgi:hypothetical protein
MATKLNRTALARLYLQDETAWLEQTAQLIRAGQFQKVDRKHLAEYLNDMAARDRREVKSRLITLMAHLLKLEFQDWMRTRSWEATILVQRHELQSLLESRTLRNHAEQILAEAYQKAVERATAETGLDEDRLPSSCPYTIEGLLETESK